MHIDVKVLDPRLAGQLPAYATPGSAGTGFFKVHVQAPGSNSLH